MTASKDGAGESARLDESERQRLERIGRQRPPALKNALAEAGFVFSIVMSQILTEYFISGFTVLVPTVIKDLDIAPESATWPASAFSLVIASTLLPFGRLADIYGGFVVYMFGLSWLTAWALIVGFAQNEIMLDVCRAIQGIGSAAFLPAGLMLLGRMYRPGPRKNIIFSIYGAMAALGFFIGLLGAGVAGQYIGWRWYFFIGAILSALTTVVAYFTIPSDWTEYKASESRMDWLGTVTICAGLVLFVFAVTDSSGADNGWKSPYIIVTLILSVVLFAAAFYIEGWVAEQPLLPFDVFKIKYVRPFILGLFFAYGTLGIYILYATLYTRNIMGVQPFQLVAWYIPLSIGGCFIAVTGGMLLHVVSGNVILFITGVAIIIDSLLFAIIPVGGGYWRWVFPAMCCSTIAIDFAFTVANVFFTTTLPARQQGLAGALGNVILQLGIAVLLGFADVVASNTAYQGQRQSYKNVFWFELACGVLALVIFMGFVRISKAESDLTADEREEFERAAAEENT